jgi:glycine cleavage system H protein
VAEAGSRKPSERGKTMNALLTAVGSIGIFLAGLVVRLGILGVVLVTLAIVFVAGLTVVRGVAGLRRRVLGLGLADGLSWKRHGYYAPGHTWVEVHTPRTIRLGLDDLAQKVLGRVTAITMPKPGTNVREGEPIAEVVCGDRRAVIPSPVSGTVVESNDGVVLQPGVIHHDPYRRGWLVAMEPANAAYTRLLFGPPAAGWLREESNRLHRFLEQELQLHAADGGEYVAPGALFLDDEQWRAMVKSFLKTE